ncbi:RidA family protein [Dyadobacter arcticus]|uniref:Enamine deaminase RidA (YjgF/YER057c/UK114 family) n=1 Tax=Dyadobacter arcticus TaxID=1078754 RepID=A0ABX0UIU4_9BACT|nr:RidA family protein [Dyadobacter arcticus]NIJ52841.1 enamine deaminase RidA (YjgF/YER057c/UK114 family) [Dyadobacter arcticus]
MSKQYLNPDNLPSWQQAFSQVVVCTNPRVTIYVSGQVGVDENKNVIGPEDLAAQAVKAFENLHLALEAAGATEKDVVRLTIYVKNYTPSDSDAISSAVSKYYNQGSMPASSWIGVQSLADERFLIEVDAVAVLCD